MGKNCEKINTKFIAIAGPSASGKSMLATRLAMAFGKDKSSVICQDDYYKDWSHLSKNMRKNINFDDAKAFDFTLLSKHISELKKGVCVNRPCYSFTESKRLSRKQKVSPKPVIIVEGLTPFLQSKLRRTLDLKIYVDIDNAESLSRRLRRDISERGETVSAVCKRYFNEVLPMQRRYVERQKKWADIVVDGIDCCDRRVITKIKKVCLKNTQIY